VTIAHAVDWPTLVSFAITCALIEITPGPNLAYLAMLGAADGRRVGYAATVGVATGLLLLGLVAAAGLAEVISTSRLAYDALRWLGVDYLAWLAWNGWADGDSDGAGRLDGSADDIAYFKRGLLTNLLNPKAALFYISLLPTFVDAGRPPLGQTLVLSLVYVAIATLIHATVVTLASGLRPFLDNPTRVRFVRRVLALALAAIAVWFAVSTRR
jgi:threonine/homoserine/homoserine lactone efflux protein